VVRGRKGEYRKELAQYRKLGFVRARVDGAWHELEEEIPLDKKRKHTIEILVDRLTAEPGRRSRIHESIETATKLASGLVLVLPSKGEETVLSSAAACPTCGRSYEPPEPRSFSFNSPYGACKTCDGLGTTFEIDPDLVVPDRTKSLREGAVVVWGDAEGTWIKGTIQAFAKRMKISMDTPFGKLPAAAQKALLYGLGDEKLQYKLRSGTVWSHKGRFRGVIPELMRRYRETSSDQVRAHIEESMSKKPCPACGGARLKPESLAVRVADRSIADWTRMSVARSLGFLDGLTLGSREKVIAAPIVKELRQRLEFLENVGVGYLTLDRAAATLAGGEAQRIRLATQIGSRLTGVLYILDEPSVGLHPRDNRKLLRTLLALRDLGNSVLVVEHGRPYRRFGPGRRAARRLPRGAGHDRGHPGSARLAHRPVPLGGARGRDPGDAAPRNERVHRRGRGAGEQSQERSREIPARNARVRDRSVGLRQEHARPGHSLPRSRPPFLPGERRPRRPRADRGIAAHRQSRRNRSVPDRADAAKQPRDLHRCLQLHPRSLR